MSSEEAAPQQQQQKQQEEGSKGGQTWLSPLRMFGKRSSKPEPEQQEPVLARGTASDVMLVVQFRPAWEIQAYLRFACLPYRVENSRYMGSASTGLYPALVDGQFMVSGAQAPLHIAKTRKNLDRNLTQEERAEAQSFAVLVREGLQPLLRVLRYLGGESTIRQTVHPPMKKMLQWPLKWWSLGAEERRSKKEASVRDLMGLDRAELYGRVQALYSALDLRLGSQDMYFFGATPTSLDACVFGHLAEAFSEKDLLHIVPNFMNLTRFFCNVCENYFRPNTLHVFSVADPGAGSGSALPSSGEQDSESGAGALEGMSRGAEGGSSVGQSRGRDAALRAATMRADYMNSLNAFDQLSACAVCAGAPYAGDPYPQSAPRNVGIPPPVLAGGAPVADAGMIEDQSSWPWGITFGVVAFLLQSMLAKFEVAIGNEGGAGDE